MRKFGRLSVLLVVVGLCFVGSVYAGLSDGLVAYYPFNGNANDESGNGNDGIVNGATLIEDRFGNYNCAYDFDGKNDYIIVNHNSNFNTTQISFSVWVLADNPTASNQMLIHKDQPNNYAHDFHIKIHDETFKVQLQNGSNQSNPSGDISTGWNHYVFTSNGNITHKAYINGEYSFSCSINWNINGNIQSIEFASAEGSDYFFDGKIDDIRIYNRVLSESEIQQLYNEQSCDCPDTCSQTELNAKYNEGYNNGVATCTGCSQSELDEKYQSGIDYCKNNPEKCGLFSKTDIDVAKQNGYQDGKTDGYDDGYSKGVIDGKNSCPAPTVCPVTQTDVDVAKQNGYQDGYSKGVIDGKNSCPAPTECPFTKQDVEKAESAGYDKGYLAGNGIDEDCSSTVFD